MLEDHKIDKTVPIPLYFQLKKIILDEVENGSYPVGTLIPTEMEIGEMFGISRTTVRQAIKELVQEGRLYRIKSKGTFVARPKIRQKFFHKYGDVEDEAAESGGAPGTEVLAFKVVDMPEEFAGLRGEKGAKAIYLYRVRSSKGAPVVRTETYLPYKGFEFLLDHDFTKQRLYDVLAPHKKLRVARISRDFGAVAANGEDCKVLGVKRGSPIHFFKTIGYNEAGEVVEYSFARYRGDRNTFHIDILMDEGYT